MPLSLLRKYNSKRPLTYKRFKKKKRSIISLRSIMRPRLNWRPPWKTLNKTQSAWKVLLQNTFIKISFKQFYTLLWKKCKRDLYPSQKKCKFIMHWLVMVISVWNVASITQKEINMKASMTVPDSSTGILYPFLKLTASISVTSGARLSPIETVLDPTCSGP